MLIYAWSGLGAIVSAVIIYRIIQEIRHSIQRSKRGEGSDYDFDID
jgi:hypothetical protein